MILPPPADDNAGTAWPAPVANTGVQEQAVSVHAVFQPAELTQTDSPPSSHTFVFCWSGTIGVTNRAAGSQPGRWLIPVMDCAAQVGLTKSLNECPPSTEEYIVPSTYSPTRLFAFDGSMMTSKPSPPAGSTIWLLPRVSSAEPLSCRPPQTVVLSAVLPALAS